MSQTAFQDAISHNHCFGCGPENRHGLQLKSHWDLDGSSIASFRPAPHHTAAPTHFVNGGIIATLIDCHCVCTAMADTYRREGRGVGESPTIMYATASMDVRYRRPTPIGATLQLRAWVKDVDGDRTTVDCALVAQDKVCAEGSVTAVRVPDSWSKKTAG